MLAQSGSSRIASFERSSCVLLAEEEVDRLGVSELDQGVGAHGSSVMRSGWGVCCPNSHRPSGIETDDQSGHGTRTLPTGDTRPGTFRTLRWQRGRWDERAALRWLQRSSTSAYDH